MNDGDVLDAGRVAALAFEPAPEGFGPLLETLTDTTNRTDWRSLARQFDAVMYIDKTRALEPLEPWAIDQVADLPETYPSAL